MLPPNKTFQYICSLALTQRLPDFEMHDACGVNSPLPRMGGYGPIAKVLLVRLNVYTSTNIDVTTD